MTTATLEATQTISHTRQINAPVEQVYASFTNRDDASDWLCFDGDVRAEVGGYALYIWRGIQHVYGIFKTVIENEQLVLTWGDQQSDTPLNTPPSELSLRFEALADGATSLTLEHSGLVDPERQAFYQDFWSNALDNLQSILETGANQRLTERAILGIIPSVYDELAQARLNLPSEIENGILIERVIPNFSAEAAGLQTDDVIVAINGEGISDGESMARVMAGKKRDEVVHVTYYRGAEEHEAAVKLKGYPLPPVPANFAALADEKAALYADLESQLRALLGNVSEEKAEQTPIGEWNTKQMLAHLILLNRHALDWLGSYLQGPRRSSNYVRVEGRLAAIIAAHPTVSALLDELSRSWAETVAILREFSPELHERRNNLWWITMEMSNDPVFYGHQIRQIQTLLELEA